MSARPETMELLVTVKAYPAISKKYGESVRVAGVSTDLEEPEWVRLFPVEYRDMPWSNRFKKYELVTLRARRNGTDQRPETWRPDTSTLERDEWIDPQKKGGWQRRREIIEPLAFESMCEVQRRQEPDGRGWQAPDASDLRSTVALSVRRWAQQRGADRLSQ